MEKIGSASKARGEVSGGEGGEGGAKSIEIHLMKKLDAGLLGGRGGSQSKDAAIEQTQQS